MAFLQEYKRLEVEIERARQSVYTHTEEITELVRKETEERRMRVASLPFPESYNEKLLWEWAHFTRGHNADYTKHTRWAAYDLKDCLKMSPAESGQPAD
jgi:hypothetical protein